MDISVKNSIDLQHEIKRLKATTTIQGAMIKQRLSSPSGLLSAAMTLFPKSPTVDGIVNSNLFHQDFLGLASRFVLPFVLNKTIFRHSNFIIKAIVGLLSQKASHYISEGAAENILHKIRSSFKRKGLQPTKFYKDPPLIIINK